MLGYIFSNHFPVHRDWYGDEYDFLPEDVVIIQMNGSERVGIISGGYYSNAKGVTCYSGSLDDGKGFIEIPKLLIRKESPPLQLKLLL